MERKKGPKSFQRFVNQIFEFIKTYVIIFEIKVI